MAPGRPLSMRQRRMARMAMANGGEHPRDGAAGDFENPPASYLQQWRDIDVLLRPSFGAHWMSNTLAGRGAAAGAGGGSSGMGAGAGCGGGGTGHDTDTITYDGDSIEDLEQDLASCDEYEFVNAEQSVQLLSGLNDLRSDSSLCDVVLSVADRVFPGHRCVLSAASPYFKAMFGQQMKEASDRLVVLKGLEPDMMELLLKFVYTGSVNINQTNVQSLTSAANLLQILTVKMACCLYMEKHMDACNGLGIHCFAETMDCPHLQEVAIKFCLEHFDDITRHDEFLGLSADKLIEIIGSSQLNVQHEEDVFTAVLNWLNHRPDERKHHFHKVLEHVRLPLMSPYFLHDCVAKQKIVRASSECLALLEEAKLYHLLPDRRTDLQGPRTQPRRNACLTEVIVCMGGEDDRVVLRSVEALQPITKSWTPLENLPFAISKHGSVVSGRNVLYLAGGEFPDGVASKQLLRFDPLVNRWGEMAPMTSARSELGLAVMDGFVYAVGGWDGSTRLSSMERYNTDTNLWESLPSLKMGITSASVVAHDGFLYVAGGAIGEDGDGISTVQRYDPRQRVWSDMAPMLIPRSGSACLVLNNNIYIIGGWHGGTENTNKVEKYDIANNVWTSCADMKDRRYRPGASVVMGCIYVLGGEEGWDLYHSSVEYYDPASDIWQSRPDMATPRSWLSCATIQVRESLIS